MRFLASPDDRNPGPSRCGFSGFRRHFLDSRFDNRRFFVLRLHKQPGEQAHYGQNDNSGNQFVHKNILQLDLIAPANEIRPEALLFALD